jgi:branched-chain amino acid transport system substrate-binding protein
MVRKFRKRSGVSTVVAAVLLIVGLVVGAGVGYAATSSAKVTTTIAGTGFTTTITGPGTTVTQTGTTSGGLSGTVNIGVLDDLTDGLSGIGTKINFTTHQAVTDINAYLQNTPYAGKLKFNVVVEDYALDNTKALAALSTFQSDGIVVTVGPLNSGTAQAVLSTADSDQIVMISPSSTAASLAIPSSPTKYLFRTAPTDVVQGAADAQMMWQDGVKYLIQIYRQDTYGSGLANYTSADFKAKGGTVVDSIPYDVTTSNFAPYLSTLSTDWSKAVSMAGGNNNSVGIQLVAFDEGATLLQQASTSYPALLKTPQPWYGTDGVQGESVFTNSTVASIMQAVRLPSTVFGYTNSSKTQTLCSQLFAATSRTCDPYAIGSYDDVWLAALSLLACNANSGSCVRSVLPTVASNYYGVSGWTELNANGDRAASDYLIYCITGPASQLAWTVCGSWSFASDTVTWTNEPSM